MRLLLLVALTWLPLLHADRACAAEGRCSSSRDPKQVLRECREKAEALLRAGDLRQALSVYEQAYREVPTPRLLLPIAELRLQLNMPQEGLHALDRYLEEMPPGELSAEQRAYAMELRQKLLDKRQKLPDKKSEMERQPALPSLPEVREAEVREKEAASRRFRVWRWVLGGAGLLLVGVGAGLWAVDGRPTCNIEPRETECPKILQTTPAAIPLVSAGTVAMVGGVIMFALDARARRQR
ncbi:MAG: hypothetical protein RMK29_16070 [Myxococcales bacterium]|nr:hypothetical protein [Myxococcota bacterium]MDW8283234.1 hypothetical protein [Myxococcales bacterium]